MDETIKEISDLPLASFLATKGYVLESTRMEGKRMVFTFTVHNNMESDIMEFYNRHGMIDALTYSETMRNLKSLIYQKRGGDGK